MKSAMPDLRINGTLSLRHPGNLNVRFPSVDAELLLQRLQPGVAASTGSACTSGQPEPSHVLRAIGLTAHEAGSSIRFSLGRFTTADEVDAGVAALKEALTDIGKASR